MTINQPIIKLGQFSLDWYLNATTDMLFIHFALSFKRVWLRLR